MRVQHERCPRCHRSAALRMDGRFATHQCGSQECSGTGQPGRLLAARLDQEAKDLAVLRVYAMGMAQLLVLVDFSDGVYQTGKPYTYADMLDDASLNDGRAEIQPTCDKGHHVTPWSQYGFTVDIRQAFFELVLRRPELLEGSNLAVLPFNPDAMAAVVAEGPKAEPTAIQKMVEARTAQLVAAQLEATERAMFISSCELLAMQADSQGFAGYHLNGDVADWSEFADWLHRTRIAVGQTIAQKPNMLAALEVHNPVLKQWVERQFGVGPV